jgi:hypothetical protein
LIGHIYRVVVGIRKWLCPAPTFWSTPSVVIRAGNRVSGPTSST